MSSTPARRFRPQDPPPSSQAEEAASSSGSRGGGDAVVGRLIDALFDIIAKLDRRRADEGLSGRLVEAGTSLLEVALRSGASYSHVGTQSHTAETGEGEESKLTADRDETDRGQPYQDTRRLPDDEQGPEAAGERRTYPHDPTPKRHVPTQRTDEPPDADAHVAAAPPGDAERAGGGRPERARRRAETAAAAAAAAATTPKARAVVMAIDRKLQAAALSPPRALSDVETAVKHMTDAYVAAHGTDELFPSRHDWYAVVELFARLFDGAPGGCRARLWLIAQGHNLVRAASEEGHDVAARLAVDLAEVGLDNLGRFVRDWAEDRTSDARETADEAGRLLARHRQVCLWQGWQGLRRQCVPGADGHSTLQKYLLQQGFATARGRPLVSCLYGFLAQAFSKDSPGVFRATVYQYALAGTLASAFGKGVLAFVPSGIDTWARTFSAPNAASDKDGDTGDGAGEKEKPDKWTKLERALRLLAREVPVIGDVCRAAHDAILAPVLAGAMITDIKLLEIESLGEIRDHSLADLLRRRPALVEEGHDGAEASVEPA
ncbi:hypothetical protein CSUB01_10790 [Colletotrichum sublineola]|uniref:Uncharacterized protein n=1 Tax=Colletotrichum sublineola TaxID=1173701 RepID=A0A066XID6_COLSU|nr:hypothetical protein CSUB01_10790 [Colletotrichum sublineola]